jgi:hypothetical protein
VLWGERGAQRRKRGCKGGRRTNMPLLAYSLQPNWARTQETTIMYTVCLKNSEINFCKLTVEPNNCAKHRFYNK